MKPAIVLAAILSFLAFKAFSQTDISDNEINFQTIFLFKNVKTQKMLEVEDGAFSKGTRVQQYFPYARNGLTDGYNQQWLIIPAGMKGTQHVYHLINYGFLKYLDSQQPLVVNDGNDGDNQLWIFQRVGTNWLIKSYLANMYVEMPGGDNRDGTAFSIANFSGDAAQQFQVIQYVGQTGPPANIAAGFMNVMPAFNDGKGLDATGAAERDGSLLKIDRLTNGNQKQQWKVNLVTNCYELKPRSAMQKCAEILSFSLDEGASAGCWTCVGGPNQKWIIIPVIRQSGKYLLFNRNSGKCLAVAGAAGATDGTTAVQHSYANQENARWRFKAAQ